MFKLSVSKSHPVTRYEVAPTERQTEDVLFEPVGKLPTHQSRRPNQALCVCVIYSSWVWLGSYRGLGPEWSLQRDFRGENWFFSADGTKSPAMSSGLKVWLTSPSNESLFCSRYASQDVRFQISQLNPTPTSTTSFSKPAQSAESFGIRIRFCLSNSQNDARA